ncbi:MAG: hypothetical protein EWV82_16110 [Microcystis aeruginosa Ma_AC_P_19900807_S299]|nr:MAG: hypothetical protein EWV82_16110 [Microcystis aeruginosa Ma_AC_P_19900807_S299]
MSGLTIETDLGKILDQINQNLKETNQKLDALQKDVTEIKFNTLQGDLKEIKGSQKAQIWALITILATAVIGTVIRFVIIVPPVSNP